MRLLLSALVVLTSASDVAVPQSRTAMTRIAPYKHIHFVHVGKTGGASLVTSLREQTDASRVKITVCHLKPFRHPYGTDALYVLTLRNPIRRFVSSFYFKWIPPAPRGAARPAGEFSAAELERVAFFRRYRTASMFAEDLYGTDDAFNSAAMRRFNDALGSDAHIEAGIAYYLAPFLETVPRGALEQRRNIVVVTQENLAHDAQAALAVTISHRIHDIGGSSVNKTLSQRALTNLRRYLAPDFACVERLNEIGVLTPVQYAALSDQLRDGR